MLEVLVMIPNSKSRKRVTLGAEILPPGCIQFSFYVWKHANKFYRFDFCTASIEQLQATHLDDIPDQHSGSLISNFVQDLLMLTNIDRTVLGFGIIYFILVEGPLFFQGKKTQNWKRNLSEICRGVGLKVMKVMLTWTSFSFLFLVLQSVQPSQVTSTQGKKQVGCFSAWLGAGESCDFYFITHS